MIRKTYKEAVGRPIETKSNGGPLNPIIKPLTEKEANCLNCTLPVSVCCGIPSSCQAKYRRYLLKKEKELARRKA